MKKSWHLDRRTFLGGAAGVALGLPWMECMMGAGLKGGERTAPYRTAFMFFPNGVSLPPKDHPHHKIWHWFPHGTERDFTLMEPLKPLEALRDDFSVLAGLSHRSAWKLPGHSVSDIFLTGATISGGSYINTISVDQLIAKKVGVTTRMESLSLSTTGGIGNAGRTHTLSYTREGQPIPAENSLRRAYNRMFGVENTIALKKAMAHKKSMLDLVLKNANSLSNRLGTEDKQKLAEYLSSVRDIEKRIERQEEWLGIPKPNVNVESVNLDASDKDPEDLIRGLYDLLFLAFQTDTTRVATYLLGTEGGGHVSDLFPRILDLENDHNLSHHAKKSPEGFQNWGKWNQYHSKQLAYFLNRLKTANEGEGSMLDNTLVFFGCSTSTLHRARNYPLILAGGKNMGYKHGRFLKFDDEKVPLANLYLTMAKTMGVEVNSFASSNDPISEVLG